MAVPTVAAIRSALAGGGIDGNVVPVWKAIPLPENDSTAAVYLKVRRGPHSFILEGITDTEYKDRFAVIGTEPYKVITTDGGNTDPLEAIEGEILSWKPVRNVAWGLPADIPLAECGAVGYVTYDCVRYFESRVAPLVEKQQNVLGLPESEWMLMSSLVVVDLYEKKLFIIALCRTDVDVEANYGRALARIEELSKRITDSPTVDLKAMKSGYTERSAAVSNVGEKGYKSMVNALKEQIVAGEIIQAVPSQRLTRPTDAHPFDIYTELRAVNPSPYMFYLDMGDVQVVGASPERLVRITAEGTVTSHPIAGTRKRGRTPEEDKLLEVELLSDPKERAEHIMLVDLGRNDVNRICQPKTVEVDRLMVVERYSHVMHIVSGVSGKLRPERTPFDAFRSIFPAGTVSGAPKVRAMKLIASLEEERRGIYAGSVGFCSFGHVIDTCIALRTLIYKKGKAYIQAGGGIVFDSDDQLEFEETEHKMRALMTAVDKAEARLDAEKDPSVDVYPLEATRTPLAAESFVDSLQSASSPSASTYDWTKTTQDYDHSDQAPVLLIDNYDSFTWNVYQYLSQLGANVVVFRNDKITVEDVVKMDPSHIVISPGPGHPVTDSGVSFEVIKAFMGKKPILGVCLGLQAMVALFNGKVVGCGEIKHGKTSRIEHDGKGLYHGVPGSKEGSKKGFSIIRYHSLGAEDATLPDCLEVTSRSELGLIMGARHKEFTLEGVQYHPESIKSEFGKDMLANFLSWKGGRWSDNPGVLTVKEPRQSSVTRELIRKLYKAGGDSSVIATGELEEAMKEIISGQATPAQVGSLLTLLPCTGDKLSPAMLEESSKAMLTFANPIPALNLPEDRPLVDIVGTGGDGKDAFNVSTASGFVVAACGCTVAKHGNRSSSGSVGSADFLEALGVNIELNGNEVKEVLEACGFCFLYAQKFHPAMKNVASIRREVGFRTIFNLLGPLTNPIRPNFQISGVSDFSIGETYAQLLAKQCKRSVVVLSKDGMDELSPSAGTHMWESDESGKVTYTELAPTDFGLEAGKYGPVETLEGVTGGTASERANMFIRLLSGDLQGSAFEDFVVVNSALSLVVAGKADSYAEAAEMAREAIRSGKAKGVLEKYISLTNAVKNGTAPAAASGPVHEMAGKESKESILVKITAKKKADLEETKKTVSLDSLKEMIAARPPAINLQHRLRQAGNVAIMAEIKRASPSRGDIDADLDASRQAGIYAHAGAAAISVLTEEHWFKGTLADMSAVSDVVAKKGIQRPAVLRKDFLFDAYQLYEARANGADTVLLIVAIMDSREHLQSLLDKSRELGMEPLVEVNNDEEMKTAIEVGAKVIGINNRNLHSFSVDLSTTEKLVAGASTLEEANDVSFVALSGIKSRKDVERYESAGIKAVLVGEALVRAANPTQLVRQLQGAYTAALVKVCGIQDIATAACAIQSGADLIGLVFAKSSRKVSISKAKEIVAAVRKLRGGEAAQFDFDDSEKGIRRLGSNACVIERAVRKAKPLIVGVFADQPAEEVWRIANEVGLDVIQLSGGVEESLGKYAAENKSFAVIKALHVGPGDTAASISAVVSSEKFLSQFHGILLDTKVAGGVRGGTGTTFDWNVAHELAASGLPLLLAGGLSVDNVAKAVRLVQPFGVDVSSGVEASPAVKDTHKVHAFVLQAKLAPAPVTLTSFTRRQLDEAELHREGACHRGIGRLSAVADEDLLHGWFGDFGGKYAPESLMHALGELEAGYYSAAADPLFQATLKELSSRYIGRPTPLYEARRLTRHCKGARIWLKREDLNHTGAHKINNAIAQALLALRLGKKRIIAETGAGQHGVATATACAMLQLECIVYMGSEDCRRQALNVFRMKNLGATVVPVNSGSCTLKDAINEAMRDWITNISTTHYLVGSAIGPHPFPTIVRDFQSIIGMECKKQMVLQAGKLPDAVVACVGGGSNAIGLFHPFVDEPTQIYGVEAGGHGVAGGKHSATIVAGKVGVLHGTRTLLLQDEEGQIIETHSISAGLDYPGVGPEHAWIAVSGRGKYVACDDTDAMKGFALLSELEGIVPALESSHAIHFGMQLASNMSPDQDIIISVSGRGDKDMNTVAETLGVDIK